MDAYVSPYKEFKKKPIWKVIGSALKKLERNNDIKITTHPDLVVGFIVKEISKKKPIKR